MPNEIWHIDTTVIKLLDGSRAYLHAVIENFSRRILAWRVSERFAPGNTVTTLLEATHRMAGETDHPEKDDTDEAGCKRHVARPYPQE